MRISLWRWLSLSLLLHTVWSGAAYAAGSPRVLNPLGQPPAIERVPMAPRIADLAGKTIYLVDIGFTDTHQLFTEMRDLLAARYPTTQWEVRTKIGTYFDDDPELWAEIKARGHGMVIGIGH